MIAAWMELSRTPPESPAYEALHWAHGEFWDLCRENMDEAWNAILSILEHDPDARVMANLAAGPLEDLLVNHGPALIQRVEARAKADKRFASLLGGVWKNDIEDDVWARVERARSHTW